MTDLSKRSTVRGAVSATLVSVLGCAAALALGGSSSGCAAIVGADDYKVGGDQRGGAAGAGGSAGTSGTGGSAGTSGTGGSAVADSGLGGERFDATVGPGRPDGSDAARIYPGAGLTICPPACTGAGLSCIESTFGPSGICTYQCAAHSECEADHGCFGADPGFPSSCLLRCPTGTCPAQMSCLTTSDGDICVPTEWLLRGIGDECSVDTQCISGMCRRKPNGWCSRPCVAQDPCEYDPNGPADSTNLVNTHGEFSWCVRDMGTFVCAPGCDTMTTSCSFYPGSTCRSVVDIDDSTDSVCLP